MRNRFFADPRVSPECLEERRGGARNRWRAEPAAGVLRRRPPIDLKPADEGHVGPRSKVLKADTRRSKVFAASLFHKAAAPVVRTLWLFLGIELLSPSGLFLTTLLRGYVLFLCAVLVYITCNKYRERGAILVNMEISVILGHEKTKI